MRFAATKLVEGDQRIEAALKLDQNEKEMIEHIIVQMEQERGLDRAAAIADMRFHFIHQLVDQTVVKPRQSKEQLRSARIDRFLTGRYTAIPAFVGIMALVFYLTFGVIGLALQNLLEAGIDALTAAVDSTLTAWNVNAAVHSLVIDGIFTGVGSVLSFLPIIVTLFFFLSLLEDTGYMARVAFVMDKLLRRIGLSGRSIVPMLIGFGCTVPGVMASRTLPSERDRKMTILLTPFMSCSAKLPIYSLFAAAFFPEHAALVMVSLYFLGIAVGILMAILLKSSVFKGEAVPFVMELPNYRLPGLKNVVQLLWEKARDFLQRAFTVIFVATIIIWFLQSFDLRLSLTADPQQSILAWLASGIAPLFAHHPLWLLCGLCRRAVPGGGCTPAGVLPALYALHRGGGLGQAGAGRQVGAYHGGKSVHRSMAGGLRHAAHHDAVKKTETGSGLQDAGRSFSLDDRCVFVLLLLQI